MPQAHLINNFINIFIHIYTYNYRDSQNLFFSDLLNYYIFINYTFESFYKFLDI